MGWEGEVDKNGQEGVGGGSGSKRANKHSSSNKSKPYYAIKITYYAPYNDGNW